MFTIILSLLLGLGGVHAMDIGGSPTGMDVGGSPTGSVTTPHHQLHPADVGTGPTG